MSDNIHQSLSHLMDNEADELELRRILKACDEQSGEHLAETWHRYHLVRSVLHKEFEQEQLVDIADRISLALEQEPEPARRRKLFEDWRLRATRISDTWMAEGALAASVAAAVVLLMPDPQQDLPIAQQVATQSSAYQQTLPARGLQQSPIGVQRVSAGAESTQVPYRLVDNQKLRQERLIRGYLMQHSEYVATNGTHGMMPIVRVSGYQAAGQ